MTNGAIDNELGAPLSSPMAPNAESLAYVFWHWRRSSVARDAYEARFRRAINDGIAIGAFRSTDPALAAAFVLTALNGIASWYRTDGRLSPDRIADHYVELALGALTETAR